MSRRRAELMLLVVTICWGVSFPAIKSGAPYISATLFVAIRFVAAALITTAVWPLLLRLLPPETAARGWSLLWERASLRWGWELGLWIAVGYTTQTVGMHSTSANNSAFITMLSVVLVPILLFMMRGMRPGRSVSAAIVLAMAGLALLTRPDLGHLVAGDLWTLGTAAAYAVYLIRLSDALEKVSFLPLLWWTIVVCALVNVGLAVGVGTPHLEMRSEVVLALVVTTIFSTMGALVLQNRFQGETTATRAALIFSAEPVFAAFFSYFWLGETLGGLAILGGGMILGAVLLTEMAGEREPPPEEPPCA